MKKLLILLVVFLNALVASADGIYTKIEKYDKFDDVIWKKDIKTLITKTDSTIIIETKGEKPEKYYCVDYCSYAYGSRDSVINLVADVYGYEKEYALFTREELVKAFENARIAIEKERETHPNDSIYNERGTMGFYILGELCRIADEEKRVIKFRTISKYQRMFAYDTDLAWIKFKDGSRIIYSK